LFLEKIHKCAHTRSNHMTSMYMQWAKECIIQEVFIQDDYFADDGDLITCNHNISGYHSYWYPASAGCLLVLW